jgi:hypothetical protein
MKEIVGSVRVLQGTGTKHLPRIPLRGESVPLHRFPPMLRRAFEARVHASWMTADGVHGGNLELRQVLEKHHDIRDQDKPLYGNGTPAVSLFRLRED